MAISAGIVSHNNPFKRKKTNPQNPSLLIQVFKLISILLCAPTYVLHLYCILPHALVFQLSIASGGKIHGGSGIINHSESAET